MTSLRPSNTQPFRLRLLAYALAVLFTLAGHAYAQCGSPANSIVAENCKTGNSPNQWDVTTSDGGDPTIQGFATDISVNVGGTVYFKISTPASNYSITIYRMGYYGGLGARQVATVTPSVSLPQTQPSCLSDKTTGLTDCGNWAVTASWQVPANAVSGIYFAHLVRKDTGGDSHIVFVVRNDASSSAILFKTSDETWQAYNYYGNGSLYGPGVPNFDLTTRARKVSYNRPVLTRGFEQESNTWVFGAEFPMVQWLEQNGYDVSYSTDVDAARNGALFKNHKIMMDSGHDEYISGPERTAIQAARDAGVNLAFFSGNEMFWKTRWENSIDGTNTPNRTLVCYKETLAFAKLDPSDPPTWTGTWRDPTFSPPADGGVPENNLTGTLFMVNGTGADNPGNFTVQVPAADGKMRFWRDTAVANLAANASYSLVPGSLGYEFDEDIDNGARPAGAFPLSTSTKTLTTDLLLDYGGTYGAGQATHHMMMYRAPSGALVFSAGTINYSWGLNSNHDNPFGFQNPNPDPNMQQAVVNLFADMGVQPATLQAGIVPAIASTDTTPPHSVITSPAAGANVNTGSTVTITGTATDVGGVVGGVEVSGDGGSTWHPATGRANWSYTWTPTVVGTVNLLSRAVDDSANLETPGTPVSLNVAPQVCPCTIFSPSSTPAQVDSGDNGAIEVGVKFRADADGSILGVRFYKATKNTGTHIGHIWSSTGSLLGTATFTNESASGWQQVNFATPIQATANTIYVVSYFAPSGRYSADSFAFQQAGVDDPPLHALASGVSGQNGVYFYGSAGGFPTTSYNASNYWVDVVYTSANTYSISGVISGNGGSGATVTLSGTENLSTTSDSFGNYIFDGIVNGSYAVSVSNPGVTFTPSSRQVTINFGAAPGINFSAAVTNPLSISGTLTGGAGATVNLTGAAVASVTADSSGNYSFPGLLSGSYNVNPVLSGYIFLPEAQNVVLTGSSAAGVNFTAQACTCISIWQPATTPALVDSNDGQAIEVGTKFRVDSGAYLTGIRFYKAAANTGTHVGHIWSSTGTLLATATFSGETASGWQQANLSTPVFVNANTTYIVSYFAPVGHYSADTNYFLNGGADRPPLHALAAGIDGPNGVYIYTTGGAFPTSSYSSTNYWVDILYAAQPESVSGTISNTAGVPVTVSLSGTAQATTTTDASGNYSFANLYGGTYTITPSSPKLVFNPGSQAITVSQSNVTGVNFAVPSVCPCNTIWTAAALPGTVDSGDAHAGEYGVKLRADSDGYILGLRFYKAATNTGTHIGNLWSESATGSIGYTGSEAAAGSGPGALLATAAFGNESPSGWQQILFAAPVPVSANTTYVASYFAPAGHYSGDSGTFATAGVDTPPLHALQAGVDGANGVYGYSAASAYPTSSFGSANYWVDIIYANPGYHSLGGNITGPGAVGATLTLSGPAAATTTADSNGNYNFSGLANGVYTLTPSSTGFIFTPSSQTITISGSHQLGANFVSSVPTYVISGQVTGAPGISVALSGAATSTVVADSSGNFSFPAVPNGSYTVTPASAGYILSPGSRSVTVQGAAYPNVNFSATLITYSVAGTITGGAGAAVNLVGSSTTTVTADSSGNFVFPAVAIGSYSIVPSLTGAVFAPANLSVVVSSSNITGANFSVPGNCPCTTIWPATAAPVTADFGDGSAVEVGVKFRVDADAYITGLRFYKATTNTGIHIAHLWTDGGALLGTATFTGESANGWQEVFFAQPVPVAAKGNYVASYFAPNGHYPADANTFLTAGVDAPPLHALASGVDGLNGVYLYTSTGGFPNQGSGQGTNYWVDVIDTPTSTYTIAGTITGAGGPGATVALSGAATGTTVTDGSGNFSFTGLSNGSYTVTPSGAFTPAAQNVILNNAHALGLGFTTGVTTYTLTGTISGAGGAGATVTLSGTASATTTATVTGTYSFPNLVSGSYTVSAANAGYVFTPPSQAVTLSSANATANFASAAQTYTLSGTISGAGGSGATVTLSGAASATTTATATGTYSFPNLVSGSYTVTAANTGYVFTPPSQAVTVSSANATANFTSAAQTYTLSGTISGAGGSGATVTLSGAASATTTATATGTYSFPNLISGSYTVTVANTGYVFTPPSQAATVSSANATANFTSAPQTYTLSGSITGAGGPGATVTLSGAASATTTATAAGTYSFAALANGSYTVAVNKTGYLFTPPSQAVTVSSANATANFTSAAQTYTLSGTISGAGGSGATVTLSGTASATTTATATGTYSFPTLANGSYTVSVGKTGYVFTPPSQAATISSANATANFTSAAQTYTISGTISAPGGSGATLTLSGAASGTTTATTSGTYSFAALVNGSYTVTVSNNGFTFAPPTQAVTVNNANATANFTSAVFGNSVSGTISGPGGNGATVRLTGAATATTTATSSGVYTFLGLTRGSYTVTPTNTGFLYTPASQNFNINGSNVTINFSSVATYTISGTITGPGASGARINLNGAHPATTTASASGAYSFTGVLTGNYTITPILNGYVYTPATQAVTVSTANLVVNFTSTAPTYTISGNVAGLGVGGVTITLTGPSPATTTTNSFGNFTFTNCLNGSYTITPSKSGYFFIPGSRTFNVNGGNVSQSFFSLPLNRFATGNVKSPVGSKKTAFLAGFGTGRAGSFSLPILQTGDTRTARASNPPHDLVLSRQEKRRKLLSAATILPRTSRHSVTRPYLSQVASVHRTMPWVQLHGHISVPQEEA